MKNGKTEITVESMESCKDSNVYRFSDLLHGLIMGIGLLGELVVMASIMNNAARIVVKPLLIAIYVCGGFYLISHCIMNWIGISMEGQDQISIWRMCKALLEETPGTVALWCVTCLAVVRILAIRRRVVVKEKFLWSFVKGTVVVTCTLYTVKEVLLLYVAEKCECGPLVSRIVLYIVRVAPAVVMVGTNTYLGYCLYVHVNERRRIQICTREMNHRVTKIAIGTAISMTICCLPMAVVHINILRGLMPEPCAVTLASNGTELDVWYEIVCLVYDCNYVSDVIIYGLIIRRFPKLKDIKKKMRQGRNEEEEIELGISREEMENRE